MKVSIIIPVYNCSLYIEQCLLSIMEQSYKNLEVIIIDDGSTDNSAIICNRFCMEDERFRYYWQENSGPSSARNKGLSKITGDFLTFVDADDILEKDAIKKMMDLTINSSIDLLVCGIETFGSIKNEKIVPTLYNAKIHKGVYISNIASSDTMYGGGFTVAKLWKVSSIKKNNEFIRFDHELKLYEDKLWIIQNAKEIENIMLSPIIVYQYRILEHSLSHKKERWKSEQILLASEKILLTCKEVCNSTEMIEVKNMYAMQLMRNIKNNKKYINSVNKKILFESFWDVMNSNIIKLKSKLKYVYVCCLILFYR